MTKITSENLDAVAPYSAFFPTVSKTPLLLSSPHSGRFYPSEFLQMSIRSLSELEAFEDAFTDELYAFAKDDEISLLCANYARSYIDINRAETSIDPQLFKYYRNPFPCNNTKNGYGIIPRLLGTDLPIYNGKFEISVAKERIKTIYKPYHNALKAELGHIYSIHNKVILLDCHSMPQRALGNDSFDAIISNRYGASSDAILFDRLCDIFEDNCFKIRRNFLYTGGYITKTYGTPSVNRHAIQIELNRSLYMNEESHTKTPQFTEVLQKLNAIIVEFSQYLLLNI